MIIKQNSSYDQADIVLYNARVQTMTMLGYVEALAIKEDRIIYAGSNNEARDLLKPGGRLINMQGFTILPGFIETHIHPPGNFLEDLHSISLFTANSREEVLKRVKEFIENHPTRDIYYGAGLNTSLFDTPGPRKELLDVICANKPIIIRSIDGHNRWLNSAAFAYMGLHRDTVPNSGILHRDIDGELWGVTTDLRLAFMYRQDYSDEDRLTAMLAFQKQMLAWGYTAMLSLGSLEQLITMHERKQLYLRVNTAQTIGRDGANFAKQIENMTDLRQSLPDGFKLSTAKFFADGVVEGGTAYMLEPYAPNALAGIDPTYRGESYWQLEAYAEAVALANQHGFDIHVHSIGDAATRLTLDAIEGALKQTGHIGARNSITHLHHVDPSDLPRFAKLGVIAAVQPFWHLKEPHWWHAFELRLLGPKRAEEIYPLGSLYRLGTRLCSSSDFSGTPEPNPFWAIKAGVTRNLYNGGAYELPDLTDIDDPTYLLNKTERVSALTMLQSFTTNSAFMLRREHELGQLTIGYTADLIVVDNDPLLVNPLELDKIQVLHTMSGGKWVHSHAKSSLEIS